MLQSIAFEVSLLPIKWDCAWEGENCEKSRVEASCIHKLLFL